MPSTSGDPSATAVTAETPLDEVLTRLVRDVPDWPEPGVLFRDITPLLAHPVAFRSVVEALAGACESVAGGPVDAVLGIEARGFILAAPVALALGASFVPVRKSGKLPGETHEVSYDLEYGSASLELQVGAVGPTDRVVLLDDVLATGGTVAATRELVARTGAQAAGVVVLIELAALGGRSRIDGLACSALRTC